MNRTKLLQILAKYPTGHKFGINDILYDNKTVEYYGKEVQRMNDKGILRSECITARVGEDPYLLIHIDQHNPHVERLLALPPE